MVLIVSGVVRRDGQIRQCLSGGRGIEVRRPVLSRIGVFDFFFFQAEDGIRDLTVTGVQTCALPISLRGALREAAVDHEVRVRVAADGPLDRLPLVIGAAARGGLTGAAQARPSARRSEEHTLNSSHSQISYAVFCLKKKKINRLAHSS